MKKILSILILFLISSVRVNAMNFAEAYEQSDKKPMLTLLYAQWAPSTPQAIVKFKALEQEFGENFNFVMLDIASPDALYFNERFHIYPHLPYVLMYKDKGKVSRYLDRKCVLDDSCMPVRVKSFIH